MTNASLKIGAFLIVIAFSFLISFGSFNICVSRCDTYHNQVKNTIQSLKLKVDSLESIINTTLKEKKDTTIIKLIPQEIKIYYPKEKNSE